MTRLFWWVRTNSQKYLLEAVQADLAQRYLGRPPPVGRPSLQRAFWKYVFVPLYRRLPWNVKHTVIKAMPGSHHRDWSAR